MCSNTRTKEQASACDSSARGKTTRNIKPPERRKQNRSLAYRRDGGGDALGHVHDGGHLASRLGVVVARVVVAPPVPAAVRVGGGRARSLGLGVEDDHVVRVGPLVEAAPLHVFGPHRRGPLLAAVEANVKRAGLPRGARRRDVRVAARVHGLPADELRLRVPEQQQ